MILQIVDMKSNSYRKNVARWLRDWKPGEGFNGLWTASQVEEAICEALSPVQARGLLHGGEFASILLYRSHGDVMEVDFLATGPRFRRRGLMAKLLKQEFQSLSARFLWLEVHSQNLGALTFYQKIGMSEKGRRKAYYRDGGDAILLTLEKSL